MIFKVLSNPHHSMVCQCVMLAVLECFAGWCWFHLKFHPLVMHEKCSCTKGIETRSLFQSWFFSHLKCCAPQVWLCESEGLLVYMNFLFPSTQNEKEKNPTILWLNPRRFPLFGLRMSQSFVIVLEGPGGVLLVFPGPCFAFPTLHLGVIRKVTNQSRKICMLI